VQSIPFIDLQAQRKRIEEPVNRAVLKAVAGGQWIPGPQVAAFEQEPAAFAGVEPVAACARRWRGATTRRSPNRTASACRRWRRRKCAGIIGH